MDRALHLAGIRAGRAGLGVRIVGAVDLGHIAFGVLHDVGAGDEIRALQTNFVAREHAEVLLRGDFHEVVAFDPQFSGERDLSGSLLGILRILERAHLRLALGIVVDDHLERVQHDHTVLDLVLQIFADEELQLVIVHDVAGLGDADRVAERAQRLGRVAAASHARDGAQSRVVPALDEAFVHHALDVSLAHDGVGQAQLREFDLLGRFGPFELFEHPVVQGSVILEFQRADGVRDALDRVLDGMRVVVHRIDAPRVARVVVGRVQHAVDDGVTHVDVRGRHVDLGAQADLAVRVLAVSHVVEDLQGFFPRTVAVGAVRARLGERASGRLDLFGALGADVGVAVADQLLRALVHFSEIVRSVKEVVPLESEPLDVVFDVADEFLVLGDRVGVVVAQIKGAAVFQRGAAVQAHGLAVSDVQVSVGFRRESGANFSVVLLVLDILVDDIVNEVSGHGRTVIGTVSLLDKILSHCFPP